jgi:hypothetical protein
MMTPDLRNSALLETSGLPLPRGTVDAVAERVALGQYAGGAPLLRSVTAVRLCFLGAGATQWEYTVPLPPGTLLQIPYGP